mgnify:CR=1 FL=1
MSNHINLDADVLIHSQSDHAPFLTVFEHDGSLTVCYAVTIQDANPIILDQVVITHAVSDDVVIHWNMKGDRAALIMNERIELVFDFTDGVTYCSDLVPTIKTPWSRQTLQSSHDLLTEFGMDRYFTQPALDRSISAIHANDCQETRLLCYKQLLTSKLFVPVTTSSEDPHALVYTFPNNMVQDVDCSGNLICSFTSMSMFQDQVGQYGLSEKKISADYLCYHACSFDDILGMTITSDNGHTILITRDEFALLSLISKPQRLNTPSLLKEMGRVFFKDEQDNRDQASQFFKEHIHGMPLVRSAYYCQSMVAGGSTKPMFCVVVHSSTASDALTELVSCIQSSTMADISDCHVFSLSDVIAQSLEQSMTPL